MNKAKIILMARVRILRGKAKKKLEEGKRILQEADELEKEAKKIKD